MTNSVRPSTRAGRSAASSEDKAKEAARQQLTRYLEHRGKRKTPERFAILERVLVLSGHFTVDTLFERLESDDYRVSRATVYNTIELLCDAGLVRRHIFGNSTAAYEHISGIAGHHHLVCSRCGRVREVKDPELDRLLGGRRYGTFQPAYTDLYVYGLCGKCARQEKRNRPAEPTTVGHRVPVSSK